MSRTPVFFAPVADQPPRPERPRAATLETISHDDASYKTLFSAPEVVRDLILGFVPDPWLHGLDYATLDRVSGSA